MNSRYSILVNKQREIMHPHKYTTLISELEGEEYEDTNTDLTSFYMQLFALYLHENNMINAYYLWMRIPENIKAYHKEFNKLFELMISIQNQNSLAFSKNIDFIWPDKIKCLMKDLEEKFCSNLFQMVTKVYSHISETKLKDITQNTAVQLEEKCRILGWIIDKMDDNIFYVPMKTQCGCIENGRSVKQLFTLTEFVSILEN